jgi:Glycosyltransferase family 87
MTDPADGPMRAAIALLRSSVARLGSFERAILLAGLLCTAFVFQVSLADRDRFHGVDLRPKVVAARAMLAGLDPYTFEWQPGMDERLLDPMPHRPGLPRATYTPPLLLLYGTFSSLPFGTQRSIWFFLEWAAMLATIVLWMRAAPSPRWATAFFGVASFFVVGNWLWRLHLERGQYYVFLALLLSVAATAISRRRPWVAAGALGLAIAFRPTLLVMVAVLWFGGQRRVSTWSVVVAAAVCVALIPIAGVSGWRSYFALIDFRLSFPDPAVVPALPPTAEGMNFRELLPSNSPSVTLWWAAHQYDGSPRFLSFLLQRESFPTVSKAFAIATTALACAASWLLARRGRSLRLTIALAVATTFVVEFFMAPERHGYSDVLLLVPLGCMLPLFLRHPPFAPWLALMLAGLAFGFSFLGNVEDEGVRSSWVRFWFVTIALAGPCIAVALRSARRRRGLAGLGSK